MRELFVYLPCYNEARNIRPLSEEWIEEADGLLQEGYKLSVVCVDDKSTDNTLAVLRELESENACIRIIEHPVNKNLGGVLDTSINDFLRVSGDMDLMCFMDADNTHKPKYIRSMIKKLSSMDSDCACVIASRYQKGSGIQGLSKHREWLSVFARAYYSLVLHVPDVRDYTCGYRLYTHQALLACKNRYGNKMIEYPGFTCMMEVLFKLHRSGCKFGEIPFQLYYDDKVGDSKMKVIKTAKDSLMTAVSLRVSK